MDTKIIEIIIITINTKIIEIIIIINVMINKNK